MAEIFDPFAQRKEPAIFDPFAQRTEEKPEKKVEEKKKPTKPADEEYGVGSFTTDALKKISGALVGGVGSMPEGLEQGARGTVRTALTGEAPTPGFKMLDTARMVLADKLGIRSAEESLKDKEKASINAEKVLDTIPHIPGLRSLSDYAYGVQKNIEDSISDPGKARIEGATPKGNIFKGEFSFGDDPTISGYALQAAGVFGSMGPVLAVSMLTKDPTKAVTRGTVVGGGMAAGEGAQNAREKLEKLSTDELYQVSPFYKNLVDGGVAPARAKEMTVSKASETGAILQGLVGALGSNVTSKLMSGAFDHLVSKVGKGALTRFGVTGTAGGLEEGLQELGEGVAANVGVKQVLPSQELGEDSAANLALGFLGGAGPSGIKGALTPAEQKQELQKGSVLDTVGGEQDVRQPISPATGAGAGVDTQPPAATTTTGVGETDTSGVVRANRAPAGPAGREAAPASSLEDFSRQYNDLRSELLGLMNKPNPTEADKRQVDLVYRDFNEVVTANADRIEAAGGRTSSFLNPAFDGNKVIGEMATNEVAGQAKAMQGDLFGSFGGANRSAQSAMALAGQDPAGALQQLEARKQRALAEFEKNRTDPTWAMTFASQLGMTKGEAARNPEAVAKHILDQTLANVEQAADQIKRTAKPSQGDLFGEENKPQDEFAKERIEAAKTQRIARADEEEFGAPIEGEEKTEEVAPAPVNQKEETVVAPDVSTEHVAQTQEGSTIKDFFDSIQSASETEESQKRHGESKNTAAGAMLSYDIVAPGETTSPGAKKMLDYLAKRVGGLDKLNELLTALKTATSDQQSRLFERNNLPDLTSRRGMDEFRDQVQQYVDSIGGSEQGIRLPTKNIPSPFHGRTIPYTETITSTGVTTQTRGPSTEGKPRRPVQGTTETEHVIVDRKLRNAFLILKQALTSGKKLSPQQSAAVTYLNSTNRSTFGQALADLAFDLAYGAIDPKEHGANSTFFGEGGKYAKAFQEWIVANLDQGTVDTLNEMVAEHLRNHAENEKFAKAISEYHDKLDSYSEQKRKDLEKRTKTKVPRAPRKVRISDIKEEEQEREVNVKNLPKIQMITEIHPMLKRMLEEGKVQEALDILANAKGNPYYASLAQRLLDTGMTADSRLVDVDVIESLNSDPAIRESLDRRLEVLRDIVVTLFPTDQQAALIAGLRSSKLRELANAVATLRSAIGTVEMSPGQQEAIEATYDLMNEEFAWNGKYDPSTDQIVLRSGAGRLTNHMFLHEALHAAASHLIDNADKLTGIQRQGYERLVELYEYSKKALASEEFNNEFYDLHEFVSYGLTDPIFQAHLRTLGYKAAPYSLWNRFTESIRQLFNAKPGRESNVMIETMLATDAMLMGTMELKGLNEAGGTIAGPVKPMATSARKTRTKTFKPGMPNQPGTIRRLLTSSSWSKQAIKEFQSMSAAARPAALGLLTLRQLDDLVAGRIPQLSNFIKVTEDFLARKNNILKESGEISKAWEKLQSKSPEMSKQLGLVMHMATITEIDPDKANMHQRNANQQLMIEWNKLDANAKKVYRDVRDFYERRYSNYKQLMNRRIIQMRQMGVSEKTILEIRNEFEKGKLQGPYFPLMRFGRFWYEIGPRGNREYYMFESQGARDAHIEERIAKDPHLADTIGSSIGNDYKSQMDFHAQQSNFLKEAFNAVDSIDVTGLSPKDADEKKQALKDNFYQSFLAYQPDRSVRTRFIHRQNKAGYSEDALRSFASSSFNMAYQLARFEFSPEMFSQLEAAKLQLKDRFDPKVGYDPTVVRENDELNDYVGEVKRRLDLILNPTDIGTIPSMLSNVGFIYYLSSAASAITNVLGGVVIGFPTLVGQKVKLNPNMSYTEATARTLYEASKAAAQVMAGAAAHGAHAIDNLTGTGIAGGIASPLDRFADLTPVEQAAYNKFVAEGLIDITATYDQSGLASTPTENYSGLRHRSMQVLTYLFHQAERFNREVVAMSAFRSAYEEATKAGMSPRAAFTKAVSSAKDVTNRSMFDYSSTNKPRYFQHPVARIVLQFKQFPQQMTFFLAHNLVNSLKGESPEVRREARARFVGTMGMAGIMSGATGLWGFSTVAAVVNAVFNIAGGDDDEIPFDFELAFVDWATKTFGKQVGTAITRGIPNAVTGLDIGSRVKLDELWFRDGRKNLDEADALQTFLVDSLGPTIGIGVNAARAVDLWRQGHGDRAIEAISPAFIKNVLIAKRMAKEGGATNLSGDLLTENDTPFTLLMQSAGLRSQELSERQYYNITVKGQEQAVLKERQNLLNYYALTFMSNEYVANREAFDKMMEFNKKHGKVAIDADTIINSLFNRYVKKAETDHGLYIDERMRSSLTQQHNYLAEQ